MKSLDIMYKDRVAYKVLVDDNSKVNVEKINDIGVRALPTGEISIELFLRFIRGFFPNKDVKGMGDVLESIKETHGVVLGSCHWLKEVSEDIQWKDLQIQF